MISAWVTGSNAAEILEAFVVGFAKGFVAGLLSYTEYLNYIYIVGSVIWDVGNAVYEAWKNGANIGECILIGCAQLYSALAFSTAPDSVALDATVKLGTSLVGNAFSEGFNAKYSHDNTTTITYGSIGRIWYDGRKSGGGMVSVGACHTAFGY